MNVIEKLKRLFRCGQEKDGVSAGSEQGGRREMRTVYFPCYGGCEFECLEEALKVVQKMPGGLSLYITDIVRYNIRFRDCLREHGIGGVIEMLVDEAPAVAEDSAALNELRRKWTDRMNERIGDYDIQCLPKDGEIYINECLFHGLNDIKQQVEMSGNPSHTYSKWSAREKYQPNPSFHIGNIWQSYPTFDSYDAADNRSYDNYVFSKEPLTEAMMDVYCKQIRSSYNFCMVHEDIPINLLPILYYEGEGDSVLLATRKGN